jgi:hypothetical protein
LYVWRAGSGSQLVTRAAEIGSIAFAPYSTDAVVTEARSGQILLVGSASGVFSAIPLVGSDAGLSRPVAAEFSRDGKKIVVADAGSHSVQVFGRDGLALGSASCDCQVRSLNRLTGNAVFRINDFDGGAVTLFDGDFDPAAIAVASVPAPAGANPASPAPALRSPQPRAYTLSSALSSTPPSSTCAAPTSQNYFELNTGSIFPWISFTNVTASSPAPTAVTARIGVGAGATYTGSTIALTRYTVSTSTICYTPATGYPLSGLAAGGYTMVFFDQNGTGIDPADSNRAFTIVQPVASTVTTGAARSPLPNANQQAYQVTIPNALPDASVFQIAPFFIASGVTTPIANSAYDCRLTTPATPTISAGQTTSSSSFTASGGTVAGVCDMAVASMTIANSFTMPQAGDNGFTTNATGMVNNAAVPFLNQPTVTSAPGATTLVIQVTGWSTTRDLSSLNFTFTANSGYQLGTALVPITVSGPAVAWYSSAGSAQYGGEFLYNAYFSISGGTSANLSQVAITAVSSQGTSSGVTVALQ